jgi:capsular polysaccharide transport system permease protein
MTDTPQFPPPLQPRLDPPRRSFAGSRAVVALMMREMATSYGRTPGGYLWAILEPALGIFFMTTLVYALGFRQPPIGSNYPIFFATGIIPYYIFIQIAGSMASSLNYSRSLLAYPAVTYIDALVARFLIAALTQILVAYVIFAGILMAYDTRTNLDPMVVAAALSLAIGLGVGIGTFNAFLFTMFPLWQIAWSVLTRPLALLSGIFFTWNEIPRPYNDYLWYNPLIQIVGMCRSGFYPGYPAAYAQPLYVIGVSVVALILGLIFLRRYHQYLLLEA